MPKVSVIIPVYNTEPFIRKCAESLFAQTLDDIEYIFVDDCSPDNALAVLSKVMEEFPHRKAQTKIVRLPSNSGVNIARPTGKDVANGDYIISCDSDDSLDIRMLETMYTKAVEDDADLVICGFEMFDSSGNVLYSKIERHAPDGISLTKLMMSGKASPCVWNKLYRKKFLDYIAVQPSGNTAEDLCFNTQIAPFCKKVSFVDELFYKYRFNSNSITRSRAESAILKKADEACANTSLVCRYYESMGWTEDYSRELTAMKMIQKNLYLPLLGDSGFYHKWLKIFPEINLWEYLRCSATLDIKLRYFLGIIRLFPLICRTKVIKGE